MDILDSMLYFSKYVETLEHSGVKRRSGRYEWGSGEIPYQHEPWFQWLSEAEARKAEGLTETELAKAMGMSTTEYRQMRSVAKAQKRAADSAFAMRLKEKGYSNVAIGERMGINESSVRLLLKPSLQVKNNILNNTADILAQNVAEKGYIDVSSGTELYLGVTQTKLNAALKKLKDEGYEVHNIYIEQATNPGKKTTIKVLGPKGTETRDIYDAINKGDPENPPIHLIEEHTNDGGLTWFGIKPPVSLDSSRLKVRYNEEGGIDKDGVIELRRGVEDISLGDSKYAQVRIAVDGTHYLKGMAMYNDNMPPGVDVIFNTNKHQGTPLTDVLKPMKKDKDGNIDMDNPFGAAIKTSGVVNGLLAGGQREYIDKNGEKHLSVINKVNEEGDWSKWDKTLASQMLSKQDVNLAQRQLNISYLGYKDDLNDIMRLTNPEIKKQLLQSFADDCDSATEHLKAAALPRQASHVILPITSLKDTEVYAPNYRNGERVVLIRYPHGGKFEIPDLVVNNNNRDGKSYIGNAKDAIGINPKVAAKLSGADFDGDTVLVIPNNDGRIKTKPSLKGLENFDPKERYPGYEGMKTLNSTQKQTEMGKITNLITDMTLQGADDNDLAAAVRHSMVIIDAEKHKLNYKQSEIDNGISALKEKYRGDKTKGASTLISRAKSEKYVPERRDIYDIDKETGKKIYKETGRTYTTKKILKDGTVKEIEHPYQTETTQMSYALDKYGDAFKLSSGTRMEAVYANYANKLYSMANTARKELKNTKSSKYSPAAAQLYSKEVKSLNSKLNIALKNAPLERKAQVIATMVVNAKKKDNPELKDKTNKKELDRVKQQAINAARYRMGSTSRKKREIDITPKEWEAIEAGAITSTKLTKILNNTNLDTIRQYATPKNVPVMSSTKVARAKAMLAAGETYGDIAEVLGVSTTTIRNAVEEKD